MATITEVTQVTRFREAGQEVRGLALFNAEVVPCDVCSNIRHLPTDAVQPAVVNGKTSFGGMGADMCLGCFRDCGIGLGIGRGQVYVPVS